MEVNYNSGQKKYILTVDQVELDFLKKCVERRMQQIVTEMEVAKAAPVTPKPKKTTAR